MGGSLQYQNTTLVTLYHGTTIHAYEIYKSSGSTNDFVNEGGNDAQTTTNLHVDDGELRF